MAVDNILDMRYFRDVLPQLRDRQLGFTLFYETKANLTKEQVKLLRDAGVLAIQPGVESLSTHVLQLMRKGVTALQNIQLLKWCKQYGVTVAWNLLYGFPGETAADYAAIGQIDGVALAPAAAAFASVRFGWIASLRTSTRRRRSGWSTSGRWRCIDCCTHWPRTGCATWPTSSTSIMRTAGVPVRILGDTESKVEQWRRAGACSLTATRAGSPELVITDTRPNAIHHRVGMNGVQREVYELCDQRRHFQGILRSIGERYVAATTVSRAGCVTSSPRW